MTLITPGYYPNTYWAERYFSIDYWPEYGAYVAPAVVASSGGWVGKATTMKAKKHEVLLLFYDYLKMKQHE
jgi:hypothetical protein